MVMSSVLATGDVADGMGLELLYGIDWKPQLSLLDRKQLQVVCDANSFTSDESTLTIARHILNSTLDEVAHRTLTQLTDSDRLRTPEFLQKYVHWMERHDQMTLRTSDKVISDERLEEPLEELERLQSLWKIFSAIARKLKSILIGETNSLQVAFDTGLAETFYSDMFEQICDERFHKLLELLTHENPTMRILEVGSGTRGLDVTCAVHYERA
ncbi:hypothetical protein B0T17DRAFT_275081 [Bombardia bombarda]|uniref:Uncharacterized protein n=1 Tax=Bombardia bombarda TaxID=252184 RepID=A0AA39X1Z3_9PEZI|nr:hypothetical protein B0T17DRAFT_275081 [Bombardia bombarda]